MTNRRKPTSYEAKQIGKYFEKKAQKEMKLCKSLNVIFTVSGLFFFGGLTVTTGNLALRLCLGAISFVIVFIATFNIKGVKNELAAYKKCLYEIEDATIIKNIDNSQQINRRYIWVKTDSAQELGPYEVFGDGNVSLSTRVILIYPLSKDIRKGIVQAMTDDMIRGEYTYN